MLDCSSTTPSTKHTQKQQHLIYNLLLALGFISISSVCGNVVPTGPCFASRSTWFADNQHGACMYGESMGPTGNGNYLIAASSMLVFDNSADCGACYEITGTNGSSVIVTVVDQCTDGGVCDTTFPHLDLSPQAFDVIADPTVAGVTSTNAMRVACPVTGGVKLAVGSNFFQPTNWEILIFNTRLPITSVTATVGGQTTSLTRQTYNYWLYNGESCTWPVTISVEDTNGDVVTFQPLTLSSGLIVEAPKQFAIPTPYTGSPQVCPAPLAVNPNGWIYQDSLSQQYANIDYIDVFQWLDYSYSATVNWACTSAPYEGSDCVEANIEGYGGVQLSQSYSFSWAGLFTDLQFAIKGATAYNDLVVGFKGYKTVPLSITTSWQLITLSLDSDLDAPAMIAGDTTILFSNNAATSTTIYFDNIRLVPADATTDTTTPETTSSTATTVPTTSPTTVPTTSPTTVPTTSPTTVPTTAPESPTTVPVSPTTVPTSAPISPTTQPTPIGSIATCPGLTLQQISTGSWTDTYFHGIYTIIVTNTGSTTATNIAFTIVPKQGYNVEDYWNLKAEGGYVYTLTFDVYAGQSFNGGGYIAGGGAATVDLLCPTLPSTTTARTTTPTPTTTTETTTTTTKPTSKPHKTQQHHPTKTPTFSPKKHTSTNNKQPKHY